VNAVITGNALNLTGIYSLKQFLKRWLFKEMRRKRNQTVLVRCL